MYVGIIAITLNGIFGGEFFSPETYATKAECDDVVAAKIEKVHEDAAKKPNGPTITLIEGRCELNEE